MSGEPEILFERRGTAGIVTLNRAHALNAVTLDMVRALTRQLDAWADDAAVSRVLVTAQGRAFSAGGDLRAVYDTGRAGRPDEALDFWRAEYPLNAMIKCYRKPYVALIDGIVMGGGVGISVNGSHRVAGDRFVFAMPEVGIGFFPDVGATWFLPRMPGAIGTFCALTGERLDAADALGTGIATQRISSSRWPDLIEALCGATPVDAVLRAFAEPPGESKLMARRAQIDRVFAADSVEAILAALDDAAPTSDWCRNTAATMRTKSPTSLKIALAQMRQGPTLSFEACMQTEYRIVSRIVHGHDFYEGVRAVIIDKDNAPRWRPCDLAAVTRAEVELHFEPLAAELALPNASQGAGTGQELMSDQTASRTAKPAKPAPAAKGPRPARPSDMLEPVHTNEAIKHAEWTTHLILFLRVMAGLSLLKGLYHWAQVCGIGVGPDGGFETHAVSWQTATIFFAVFDLVAAVGLWLAAAWGAVVWLTSVVSMAVVELFFPQVFGGSIWVVLVEMALLAIYLWLAIVSSRERPS